MCVVKKKFNKFGFEEDSADSDVEWDAYVLATECKYVQVKSMYRRVDSKIGSWGVRSDERPSNTIQVGKETFERCKMYLCLFNV